MPANPATEPFSAAHSPDSAGGDARVVSDAWREYGQRAHAIGPESEGEWRDRIAREWASLEEARA